MDNSTHQKGCENPNLQQQKKKTTQEKAMEKLRETILKLANKEPNVPLSKTRNSILRQHLHRFLSGLHTTPVHPPYTWMIGKALKELDEEGGSNEDSISEFIKNEYDSLPRAHMTLLKHHLQKMTEKGEILMIDGGRLSLPGDRENLNSKKKVKRKRSRNASIKQKKPRQKEKKEEDPRHEVPLKQPIKQRRGRPAKYKEGGAKIDDSTFSAVATNKEVLCLDDPQDEVRVEEPKAKRRGRALKGKEDRDKIDDSTISAVATNEEEPKAKRRGRALKGKEDGAKISDSTISAVATNEEEPKAKRHGRALKGKVDGADPDSILLKDLRLSKMLTKKQNNQGLGRRWKAQ